YGEFHSIEAVNPYIPVVKSFASVNDAHPLATSEPLMTYLNVEGIAHFPMEVDSAASHNIISEGCFKGLQKQLKLRGMENSKKLPRDVKIRLADGKMATQDCQVVQLNVSTDLHKFTKPLALTFLVVRGPNNLIGRHSLARLWPTEFERFKQATCKNFKIGNSENKSNSCNQINKVDKDNSVLNLKSKQNSKTKPKPNSGKQGGDLAAKALPAKIKARESNRPAPVHSPPPPPSAMLLQPAQTGFDAGTST
ncbi:MAG: retroviral-like aspartic protease, partial [Alphaproteobacteria bacterium]|nr:retroviral-like aspartic protease [Alphaproteobacteria bacterium]